MTDAPVSKLSLQIPLAHAGGAIAPSTVVEKSTIELDGKPYHVRSGYAVPVYEHVEQIKARRDEELVTDRARRFFYSAQPELDIRLTRQEIGQALYDYENCPITDLHRIKARYLVGAMVNRMERLARAVFQKNIDGIGLEIEPESGGYELSPEEITKCRREFTEYYMYLIASDGHDPIRWVNLRETDHNGHHRVDHDGVLLDLIREMGKPIAMPEEKVRGDIVLKIGYTMAAIDEAQSCMRDLVQDPLVRRHLNVAFHHAVGLVHDENGDNLPHDGAVQYEAMLTEMADLCRARSGLKSEDSQNFSPVRERISYLNTVFHRVHENLGKLSLLKGHKPIQNVQHMLNDGLWLMRDMASSRLPRNHHAQDIYAKTPTTTEDLSSVGLLKTQINRWLETQQAKSPTR